MSENSSDLNNIANIAGHLRRMAQIQPYKKAVVAPAGRNEDGLVRYIHMTLRQLDKESDCLAHGLEAAGITQGMRTVLMVTPGLEFITLTFALFKAGIIPVIVDPGMGIKPMLRCLGVSRAEAFIGIPRAHLMRKIYPKHFKTVRKWVTVGRRWLWGGVKLDELRYRPWKPYPLAQVQNNETAAILFTSGSTGPAKGVVYTHATFDAQVRHIRSRFEISSDEIDLPTFPLFALFDPAMGMTAVIPDMDPTKPAQAEPQKLLEAIFNHGVTNMFASPALLRRLGAYSNRKNIKLPSLKRIICAGAPVTPDILNSLNPVLDKDAEIFTPYGATEAMPVIVIGSNEILSKTAELTKKGYGICVGRPIKGIEVKIINIYDDPIRIWSDDLVLQNGEIGEIAVRGDVVTQSYFESPMDDLLAKIKTDGTVWHRMGDLGWQDKRGRIWFCGRKNHRVVTAQETLFTIPCESIFNNHPNVFRSALVGIGDLPEQTPVIIIELHPDQDDKNKSQIRQELLELAVLNEQTKDIDMILFHNDFPVDVRHNSKIFREKLAVWASKQLE
ncbi:fatty acid CoA ligase family protein [Desulfococcaceae bacterium HSG9]|nr:fatty acid CoA ligase family protein [Desulfococcaceae bacterium HSG9]